MSDNFENELNGTEAPFVPAEAPAETPVEAPAEAPVEAPAAAPAEPETRVNGEYRFVRETPREPEEPVRSAYSDAGYVPASEASAVPPAYHCAHAEPAKPKKEKKQKKEKTRRGMPAVAVIALCLVCAILGGLAGGALPQLLKTGADSDAALPVESTSVPAPEEKAAPAASDETVINRVAAVPSYSAVTTNLVNKGDELTATQIYYDLALKQVVGISTEITYTNVFGYTTSGAVTGSGFVISEDGYIMTNHHVIADAAEGGYDITVLTYDGTEYPATIVGYEDDNDVAVLKIDATGLNPVTIGSSDALRVGETIYAVGNPLGELDYTMTDGMVSATDRDISSTDSSTGVTTTINMFQLDAPINSGNSGGPIYNTHGEVVGIATAKYSSTGVEGLGFAIPIDDAINIATDLITSGYVRGKAYFGIGVRTVSASVAQYYNMVEGAYVASVDEGGCAEKAGLEVGDIIIRLGDAEVKSMSDLISAKKDFRAGETAIVTVWRDGEEIDFAVTFDEETPELVNATEEKAAEVGAEEENSAEEEQRGSRGGFGGYGSYDDFFNDFFGMFPFG